MRFCKFLNLQYKKNIWGLNLYSKERYFYFEPSKLNKPYVPTSEEEHERAIKKIEQKKSVRIKNYI